MEFPEEGCIQGGFPPNCRATSDASVEELKRMLPFQEVSGAAIEKGLSLYPVSTTWTKLAI